MAFIHNASAESLQDNMDLFSLPPTNLSLEHDETLTLKPLSALNELSPIEFSVSPSADDYTDMSNTFLYVVISVTNEDGTSLADEDHVATVNNTLHSIFSDVSVTIANKLVSSSSHLYPYKAYIETLFNYSAAAKDSHQTLALYYEDEASRFEDRTAVNTGYNFRSRFVANSKKVPLYGRLSVDMFGQNKFLINGVGFSVILSRSKNSFSLMSDGVKNFKIKIHDATLCVRRVRPAANILLAHAKVLNTTTAKYPFSRIEVKNFTIPSNIRSFNLDNIIVGQLPVRVFVCFVKNASLNGRYTLNPFNFDNFKLNYLALLRDGSSVGKPFLPKFSGNHKDYVLSYYSTFVASTIGVKDDGYNVSRDDYPYGFCLHGWDLTSDLSADQGCWSLRKNGSLGFEIHFEESLVDTLSCIVYAEFQNLLEIDLDRRVTVDY
jgi:hypothetical protein